MWRDAKVVDDIVFLTSGAYAPRFANQGRHISRAYEPANIREEMSCYSLVNLYRQYTLLAMLWLVKPIFDKFRFHEDV